MRSTMLAAGLALAAAVTAGRAEALVLKLPAQEKVFQLGKLKAVAWYSPAAYARRLPLVVFSHDLGGCPTKSSFLARAIAAAGFVVVAPLHADARCEGGKPADPPLPYSDPKAWSDKTGADRKAAVVDALSRLKADSNWEAAIDWNRIAVVGTGLGGYTALGVAGAWASWDQPRIKAVLAMVPFCAPFLDEGQLEKMNVPVMYQGGSLDMFVTPDIKRPGGCFFRTAKPAYFLEFDGAAGNAWTDGGYSRQSLVTGYAVAFLQVHLNGVDPKPLLEKLPGVVNYLAKR